MLLFSQGMNGKSSPLFLPQNFLELEMKPEDAEFFAWDQFVIWCGQNGIDMEYEEDWNVWWDCWKTAYKIAMNEG